MRRESRVPASKCNRRVGRAYREQAIRLAVMARLCAVRSRLPQASGWSVADGHVLPPPNGRRRNQGQLWFSQDLGALLVIFFGRDLVSPVLAQQLLQALRFVSCDGRGRALERRKRLRTFEGLWLHWGRLRWRNGRLRVQLLHLLDRKSTRLNSSHLGISYAV